MKKLILLLLFIPLVVGCNSSGEDSTKSLNVIVINSNDTMLFDKNVFYIEANKKITLTLNHKGIMRKDIMGHNFVLLKRSVNIEAFLRKAMNSKDNDYIPFGEETIAYTKLLGGGESDTITFTIQDPGRYLFLCSFPNHFPMMKGELIVR